MLQACLRPRLTILAVHVPAYIYSTVRQPLIQRILNSQSFTDLSKSQLPLDQFPSTMSGMPVPVQPLFPISGAPAAEGAAQPHSGAHQQVAGVAAGGSLFPINLQDPAKPVASAGQPGMHHCALQT